MNRNNLTCEMKNHEAITQATTDISPYRDEPSGSQTVMLHGPLHLKISVPINYDKS